MLAFLLAFVLPLGSCRTINADRIYARDLAAAAPVFSKLPPDTEIGFAPVPGLQRTFRVAELQRIAKANRLEGQIGGDVCFAWEVAVPDGASILSAVNKALSGKNAQVELLEQSSLPAPKGEAVFPLSGLSAPSTAPVVWRGYISYAGGKRFAIWARVRVTIKEQRLGATEALTAGEPISEAQIRLQTYEGPLTRESVVSDPRQVVGKVPRWNVPAGAWIAENLLATPNDIERGETVSVVVLEGNARIVCQGIAEESGHIGVVIRVRNPKSGRVFKARIDAKGKVQVVPGGQFGLAVEEAKS